MKTVQRIACAAWLAVASALPLEGACAGTILETAAFSGTNDGDYILSGNNLIGAAFTLDQATDITGVGAEFQGIYGTVFGAIVPLASLTSVPTGSSQDLASSALAHVIFASGPSGFGDLIAPLGVSLQAGTYAVVFGSGQFGADGYIGLGDSNTPIRGDFPLFQSIFSNDWNPIHDSGVRILVEGQVATAVPEPESWSVMILGLGAAGGVLRQRRRRLHLHAA